MKVLKISLWGLVLLWAGVIFYLSSQTATQSSDLSGSFIYELCGKLYYAFSQMSENEKLELVSSLQGIVRTMAHICEYGILGILLRTALIPYKYPRKILLPSLIGLCYAVSDEIHQYFVPGRAYQLSDIMCDTLGCFLGVAFVSIICIICRKIWIKKSQKRLQ